ncbi:MaoC/PaaZ C-terminal domain-containing protein [Streptomyces sp. NPDC087300]|uniref:MaoC/PaaZ C-terminal domain-containing protein n=1 Tax=Streptomyces sp. NPDC087300 TaxID=3365780 RepID=UPI00381A402F
MSLLRAALASPFKRPSPDAQPPTTRLRRTVRADPARLTAYTHLCGFPELPDGIGSTLPPTYPHVLAFPLAMRLMCDPEFPLPLLGLVHTSIGITQHQAIHPTEELQLDVHIAHLGPHRRGTEVTLVTEARAADGTLLWESQSTYLARHKTPTPATSPTQQPTPAPGIPGPGTPWRLAPDLGRRYSAVSGDRNPIHLHPLTARPFGFPRAIAHGMWTAARCLAEHDTADDMKHGAKRKIRVEFKAPVPLPSTVTYASRGPAFELRSATGKPHLTGSSVVLP